jgi:hypothetical protein
LLCRFRFGEVTAAITVSLIITSLLLLLLLLLQSVGQSYSFCRNAKGGNSSRIFCSDSPYYQGVAHHLRRRHLLLLQRHQRGLGNEHHGRRRRQLHRAATGTEVDKFEYQSFEILHSKSQKIKAKVSKPNT